MQSVLRSGTNKFMSRPEVLQVKFRAEEADRIRSQAEGLGLSHSAFIRSLVLQRIMTKAWWARSFDGPDMEVRATRSDGINKMYTMPPDFILELAWEGEDGGGMYRVFDGTGAPLTVDGLRESDLIFRDLDRGRVMLRGSHTLWRVVRSLADENVGGQIMWLLAPDRRSDPDKQNPAAAR